MMKIIPTLVIVFLCSITSNVFAQMDGSIGGKKKGNSVFGIITAPAKEVKKPKALDFDNNNGFKTAHKEQQKELQKKQAQKDLENKGIITPELLRKITLQKNIEKSSFRFPLIDKDLGVFRTKSKNLNIFAFDYGYYIDGDVISIYVNGDLVVENYTLGLKLKKFTIPLEIGFNKIEIVATHEGKYSPNTGSFTFLDDFDAKVSSDNWALAKGAKVIAMVIREEEE